MKNFVVILGFNLLLIFVVKIYADGVMSFDVLLENQKNVTTDNICPNKRTKCTDRQTCCQTKHNSYHCCKYANAVCCPDKFHCCPEGSTCDAKQHKCVKCAKSNVEMGKLIRSLKVDDEPKNNILEAKVNENDEVMCPNNKTKCKDTKTCCITKHNNYYCCPHKNAVCCSDKYQCCPEGTKCDLKNKKCLSASFVVESQTNVDTVPHQLFLAEQSNYELVFKLFKMEKRCADQQHTCPGKKNCCVMDAGKFGCCKFNHGVCCPDLKTCCPHQTECDDKNNRCIANRLPLVPQ